MENENIIIPILIGNYAPLRFILRESDKWEPTLKEINSRTYDYVKLHRISTYLDIGISPLSLGVGFDGSLILPATQEFRNYDVAASIFNKALTYLMFGGIYSEAIVPNDITSGKLNVNSYYSHIAQGKGRNISLHYAIQTLHVSTIDVINLLDVEKISTNDFESAYYKGKDIFEKLGNISPSILLNGISHFIKHEYSDGLISLWTCVEQILNEIWIKEFINDNTKEKVVGRKKFLEDTRTWTTSTKIEMLSQRKIIRNEIYNELNISRKSRNQFIHAGTSPKKEITLNTLTVLFKLYSLVLSNYKKTTVLKGTLNTILKNYNSDIYTKRKKIKVSHYLPIPPVPGDPSWGDKPFEIIEELVLKPIDKQIS